MPTRDAKSLQNLIPAGQLAHTGQEFAYTQNEMFG